jgi:MULE transposase domain
MPLLDIVGSTACNSTFYVGFAFVSNEQEPSYEFVLKNLADIYRQLTLPSPKPILTDKAKALLNAISKVFPKLTRCYVAGISTKTFLRRRVRSFRKRLLELLQVIAL